MRGPTGTSLYSGHPLAMIRITPPIKNVAPDVQFSAQYANTFAFQYAFHNRQPKLRRKNMVAAIRTSRSLQFVLIFRVSKLGCTSVRLRFKYNSPGFKYNDVVVKNRKAFQNQYRLSGF
jgi:hypothetical protein